MQPQPPFVVMRIKYLTHAAVIRCTHGGLLQLVPPRRRSLYSGGSPIITDADLFAGKIIGCPQPFKPCISVVEVIAGLADRAIVDGQIPMLMTLQALTDGGAVCSAVFDPVTKLETDGGAVSVVRSPDLAKDRWWRGQWNDFVRMFTDPASLAGLLVGLVLAILAVLLIPAGLSGLALALSTLGAAIVIGVLSALAATVVSNLRNGLPWNSNLLRAMLHGAGIGIAFAGAGIALAAAGLAAGSIGFIAAMAAVGAGIGIISNKLAGRAWDESLLANAGVAGAFAALGKFLPRSRPAEEPEPASPVREVPAPKFNVKPMLPKFEGEELPGNTVWPPGKQVIYLTESQREALRLQFRDGRILDAKGNAFDTRDASTHWSGCGRAIFIMDENGNWFASKFQEPAEFHHSSLSAGKPIAAAGEVEVENGKLVTLSDHSGHYQPTSEMTNQATLSLEQNGIRGTTYDTDLWTNRKH